MSYQALSLVFLFDPDAKIVSFYADSDFVVANNDIVIRFLLSFFYQIVSGPFPIVIFQSTFLPLDPYWGLCKMCA